MLCGLACRALFQRLDEGHLPRLHEQEPEK
jgi:hypothetical protein